MASELTAALTTSKNETNSIIPKLWLFRLQVSATDALLLTSNSEDVTTWEGDAAPFTETLYNSFPIGDPKFESSQDGQLVSMEITASTVSREIIEYLDTTDITGLEARVRLIDNANLGDVNNATPFFRDLKYYILGLKWNNKNAIIEVGHFSLLQKRSPRDCFNRNRCRHRFGSLGCGSTIGITGTATGSFNGYDVSLVSRDNCDNGLATVNGCEAHGALEKALGLPVIHPRRFGGFPGIVKGKGY